MQSLFHVIPSCRIFIPWNPFFSNPIIFFFVISSSRIPLYITQFLFSVHCRCREEGLECSAWAALRYLGLKHGWWPQQLQLQGNGFREPVTLRELSRILSLVLYLEDSGRDSTLVPILHSIRPCFDPSFSGYSCRSVFEPLSECFRASVGVFSSLYLSTSINGATKLVT